MLKNHFSDVEKLMRRVRETIDFVNLKSTLENKKITKTIIIMTSGGSNVDEIIDLCIKRMNRIIEREAHRYGFLVLERGEIERRLLYKSISERDYSSYYTINEDKENKINYEMVDLENNSDVKNL